MMGEANLFETAMEEVAMKHFERLFETLMADPTPEAFGRFESELEKLVAVSSQVDELVKAKYGSVGS